MYIFIEKTAPFDKRKIHNLRDLMIHFEKHDNQEKNDLFYGQIRQNHSHILMVSRAELIKGFRLFIV